MAESSNAFNAATFTDHSEVSPVSFDVYNRSDDELTIPNYMTHAPTKNMSYISCRCARNNE